jgi:dihydrolipoamide dehydrogenase
MDCKVTVKTKTGNVVLEAEIVLSAVGIEANIENIRFRKRWY